MGVPCDASCLMCFRKQCQKQRKSANSLTVCGRPSGCPLRCLMPHVLAQTMQICKQLNSLRTPKWASCRTPNWASPAIPHVLLPQKQCKSANSLTVCGRPSGRPLRYLMPHVLSQTMQICKQLNSVRTPKWASPAMPHASCAFASNARNNANLQTA